MWLKSLLLPIVLTFLGFFHALQATESPSPPQKISWQGWSEGIFNQAKKENRLVILDLEAVWCHWCHVMDQETYASPEVAALVREHFLALRVDQDSRPDLANRYRDYGWPATIFFDADGRELAKRAGFIPAEEMKALLKRLVENPKAVAVQAAQPHYSEKGILSEELRSNLQKRHREAFDPELGGLRLAHKFVDADSLEYALSLARDGDASETQRARQTLKAAMALLDPAWGGVYQYSHGGDWSHPHFEKILSFQRDYLKIYSLAYLQWGNPEYLTMTRGILKYLKAFLLSPEGAFYTSQDADVVPGEHSAEYFSLDDGGRRKLGIPRVDRHLYSRENGWVIEGLLEYYRATGDPEALSLARGVANWVLKNRSLAKTPFAAALWLARTGRCPVGGFGHDAVDSEGLYLGDSLAMGRAFLALYGATGERAWLNRAGLTADFILRNFPDPSGGGYLSAVGRGPLRPVAVVSENISVARFLNLLSRYAGKTEYKGGAETAMRFLATPEIATESLTEAGILLADEEMRTVPTHITIIGAKEDAQAQSLFRAALAAPGDYLRSEWWDRREGPMPNADVQYPEMKRSAAFLCSQGLCSSPVFEVDEIPQRLQRLVAKTRVPVS